MATIYLSDGSPVLVDDLDYPALSNFTWIRVNRNYACRMEYLGKVPAKGYRWKTILMHRQVLNLKTGDKCVDHINGNGLDNRRLNLRLCTTAQNVRNSGLPVTNKSGYKGVSWSKARKKWVASIYHHKSINLGGYKTKKEAALIYNKAAVKLFGEFARTNQL